MSDLAGDDAESLEMVGLASDFLEQSGRDLLGRWAGHQRFWDARREAGLDSFWRTSLDRVGPEGAVLGRDGERMAGVNFAAQDALSLASHPAIREAATAAIGRWGVHGAGTPVLQGGCVTLAALEEHLAAWLSCRDVTLFPSGWAAGFGAVRTLVRADDHVVMDVAPGTGLHEGVVGATRQIHRVSLCAATAVARRLAEIRARDVKAGILVIAEALTPMHATVPDLAALQRDCRAQGATLLVDVAQDLGAVGDGGFGFVGEQGLIGEIDILVGSFAKSFAANGGFVASSAPGLKQALRRFAGPLLFSGALSPVQAAVIDAALGVIRSREGAKRRRRLMGHATRLREALAARAFRVLGEPAPIVPVWLGPCGAARRMTRAALAGGALVNLVEHPLVGRQNARWRLQLMADHTSAQIDRLVEITVAARAQERLPPMRPRLHAADAALEAPLF